MTTVEVAHKDWARTLDEFSAVHDGQLVSLDILGLGVGLQPEIRELPLRGVTAEAALRDPTITIAAARLDGEHITHIVREPTHVRIEKTHEGVDAALRIESQDGLTAILRFKPPAGPARQDMS